MADVKTISGVFRAYAEHPLPKSQFRFGLGIMSWQDTEQELLWQFLVETKEIMLLLTFLRTKRNAGNKKYFF
jgi:nitric oxide reductase large subunit